MSALAWVEEQLGRPLTLREQLEFDLLAYGIAMVNEDGDRVDPAPVVGSPLERFGKKVAA